MDMTKRKGVCTNFGQCEKADNHETQEVGFGESFVCSNPECGKELTEIKPKSSKKIYYLVGSVVVCAVVAAFLMFNKCCKDPDVIVPVPDSNKEIPHDMEDTMEKIIPIKRKVVHPQPPTTESDNSSAVEWGEYVGPVDEYGKAHGMGSITRVTNEYQLDNVHKLKIGDRIENARFKHGELISGTVYTRDNTTYPYNMDN